MILAASGIDVAGEPVDVAVTVPALVGRADDPRDLAHRRGAQRAPAAPTTVCWRMNAPFLLGQDARLLQHGDRDRELADVVELGGEAQLLERLAAQARAGRRRADDSSATTRMCSRRPGSRSSSTRSSTSCDSPSPCVAAVLLLVEALVGEPERGRRIAGLVRQDDGADLGVDR